MDDYKHLDKFVDPNNQLNEVKVPQGYNKVERAIRSYLRKIDGQLAPKPTKMAFSTVETAIVDMLYIMGEYMDDPEFPAATVKADLEHACKNIKTAASKMM